MVNAVFDGAPSDGNESFSGINEGDLGLHCTRERTRQLFNFVRGEWGTMAASEV